MSMDRFLGGTLGHAQGLVEALAQARVAKVTGWDAKDFTAKCSTYPEDVNIGWLPVAALTLGPNSYGMAAPVIGSQVIIIPQEADANSYMVLCAVPNDDMPITSKPNAIDGEPVLLDQGEFIVSNESTVFRVSKTKVFIKGDLELQGKFTHKGDTEQTGKQTSTGDIKSNANIIDSKGSLDKLRGNYNTHAHTGVTTGSGTSGTTNKAD